MRESAVPPSDLVGSVARALKVLEVVGESPTGLTTKQIARRCDITVAAAYRMLRTLAHTGYVLRREDGGYMLGLAVADRFRELVVAMRGPVEVSEVLRAAAAETGYSHYMATFVSGRVAITATAEGSRSPYLEDLVPGFDDGAHATALGKTLLATLEPRAADATTSRSRGCAPSPRRLCARRARSRPTSPPVCAAACRSRLDSSSRVWPAPAVSVISTGELSPALRGRARPARGRPHEAGAPTAQPARPDRAGSGQSACQRLKCWRVRSNARQRRWRAGVFPHDLEAPKSGASRSLSPDTGAALRFRRCAGGRFGGRCAGRPR